MFAVYMPPHEPSPGANAHSMRFASPRHLAGLHRADRLERVDDRDVLLGAVAELDPAGRDRAGVEEHAGEVEAGRGHEHAGQRLVAAREQHGAVEALGLHDGLDAVGDDLAADEREVHALVAHRDAVGDARPCRTAAGSRRRSARPPSPPARAGRGDRLQGVISFQDDAMPIWGLSQSASPIPTARSIPREVVASIPSVTTRDRGLMSIVGTGSGRFQHVSQGIGLHGPLPCRS